jgi:phosphoglycolate phosphatase-like HAD superfamily hydrolase
MPIAIFDIDGTLTDTVDVDAECFEAAVRDVVKAGELPDWRTLDDVTDASILRTVWKRMGRGELPDHAERKVAARMHDLLTEAHLCDSDRFQPVAGAQTVFQRVRVLGGHVAIATGGWRPAAELKLDLAAIPHEGVPIVTASERVTKKDILRFALLRAEEEDGATGPVVYFGDAVWDASAAKALDVAFVGIASGDAADELAAAGAVRVIPDYNDAATFIDVLEELWSE